MNSSSVPTNFREELAARVRKAGIAWVDAILTDQANHWLDGKCVPVEAYFAAVPALQSNHQVCCELIVGEFQLSQEVGKKQSPLKYLERFPEYADALRSKLDRLYALRSSALTDDEDSGFPSETPTDSGTLPSHLGGFQIHGSLGGGGQGLVYRAYDPRLFRDVALKVMRPELLAEPSARRRFLREAQKMAAASSDHVVTIFQSGEVDGFPFLVMELLKGEPLSRRLERRRLSWQDAAQIGLETARGLQAVHVCRMVHRDIKPSNIWLEDRGGDSTEARRERVKILDFGLARTFTVDEHLTQGFVGTAPYSSPEQAACSECDYRSDLFSLGCVLYLMVTGQQPFTGPGSNDILMQVKTHLPPPAAELAPETPDDLSRLIERLLAKEPAQRPASAEEVVSSLSHLIEREDGSQDARLPVSGDPTDPHLADLLSAWPILTASIRGAIATLIQGCSSQPIMR